jgi:alpha-tubulin suppressor-like RCC1 family protein
VGLAFAADALVAGCAPSGRVLTLRAQSGLEAYEEARSVSAEVFRGAVGCDALDERPLATVGSAIGPADGPSLRRGELSIGDVGGLAEGLYTVRATLFRPPTGAWARGAPLVERCVSVSVSADRVVRIPLTADCVGVVCPRDGGDPSFDQCLNGACVDPRCELDDPTTARFCCDSTAPGADCEGAPAACEAALDCASPARCVTELACEEGVCVSVVDACDEGQYCDVEADRCRARSFAGDAGLDASVGLDAGVDAPPPDAWIPPTFDAGPLVAPSAEELAAGARHACAIRTGRGDVVCWGVDEAGELGRGLDPVGAPWPALVPGLTGVSQLALGDELSCALRSGEVWCWGSGYALGHGSMTPSLVPVRVLGISDAVEITAGVLHACARHASGEVSCWGHNADGQLGDGTNDRRDSPVRVMGLAGIVALARGPTALHTCAHDGARLFCWGDNQDGQLGDGTTRDSYVPLEVPGVSGVRAVSVGFRHTCAATASEVLCWGHNGLGELGTGAMSVPVEMPVRVASAPPGVVELALGSYESCARAGTSVWCWGEQSVLGEAVGDSYRATPGIVPMLGGIEQLVVGDGFACGRAASTIWCWGDWYVRGAPDVRTIAPSEVPGFPP